jgi:hypothetical protein
MHPKYAYKTQIGPSIGISLKDWLKLILTNGKVAFKNYPRVFLIDIMSIFGIPFRFYEKWRLNKKISSTELSDQPIFIVGHWRSGTTHLHNLLVQDPQFGYITMLQAAFPKSFITSNFFKRFMNRFLPQTRPMDAMKMGIYEAQEEEMAMGNMFPYSFYNGWYFPRRMMEFYFKYVRFNQISLSLMEQWRRIYDFLLKKASFFMKGRRLILKNPVNTARIKFLLDLYPNAKFIHIYRNPYEVYASTRHFYKTTVEAFMLQRISDEEIEDNIFKIYSEMMKSYFRESRLIPKGNLVELRFEDLEKDPIAQLHRIYYSLDLKDYEKAEPIFLRYLQTIKSYKKNKFDFSKELIDQVKEHWNFTLEKWGYNAP